MQFAVGDRVKVIEVLYQKKYLQPHDEYGKLGTITYIDQKRQTALVMLDDGHEAAYLLDGNELSSA